MSNLIVTFTVSVDEAGNIWNDTQTHGRSFAEVYQAFHAIKREVDRQIAERRNCPYNPMHSVEPTFND